MAYEDPKDRKLRVTRLTMWLLLGGLVGCLVACALVKESAVLIGGLYTSYALGVGSALALFINGNVKVHQAQVNAPPPGGTP